MHQLSRLTAVFAFALVASGITACGGSTEIPTVAHDPWATPDEPDETAGTGEPTDNDGDVTVTEDMPACGSGGANCNPDDLGGETCTTLGMGNGTLACDAVTCTYDTSMCESISVGSGGDGAGATTGNNGMGGSGTGQFFGGSASDGGTFFGGNFFGGNAGMSGGTNAGNGGNAGQPPFFGGNFFGGAADGGTPFFGGNFFGGGADGGTQFFGGGFFGGGDTDGGTGFFGGGFFGGGFFGGGGNQDPMDAGI